MKIYTKSSFLVLIYLLCMGLVSCKSDATNKEVADEKSSILKPLLIDKATLSGVGLQQVTLPDTPERQFFQKNVFRGTEISVYVVSSESWTAPFEQFWFDEFIFILNGEARVGTANGDHHFKAYNYLFAPKGFKGEWEVKAGKNLHYELSVITNKRADSTAVSSYNHPMLLDPNKLSGTQIEFDANGYYHENLFKGVELSIDLQAEQNQTYPLSEQKERLICILSGQLTIEDAIGNTHQFHTGDYVVIPEGLEGTWTSQGHGFLKYISVQKTPLGH